MKALKSYIFNLNLSFTLLIAMEALKVYLVRWK